MDTKKFISDLAVYMKYAKYNQYEGRRETYKEIVDRNKAMHKKKYKHLGEDFMQEIDEAYQFVYDKKLLPSMRSLQFGGRPIEVNPARINNCCALPIDHIDAFAEVMFLLLGGCGVGFSVQNCHTSKLPTVVGCKSSLKRFLVGDSIEGWADAIKVLMYAYFQNKSRPVFDYSDIRPKGTLLITAGGKAPGHEPLEKCVNIVEKVLQNAVGRQLKSLEVHDIVCHIANAVLAGGIRRSALISLFDKDDEDMLACKHGSWWEQNEQRGRANNSAILKRGEVSEDEFKKIWKAVEKSGCGEPGIYWTNNFDYLTNPCCFDGDTLLKTSNGYKKFSELAGLQNVKLVDYLGNVVRGCVWNTGEKECVKVRNSAGDEFVCTADHRFITVDGMEAEAQHLAKQRIMPFIDYSEFDIDFVKLGFIQGDGALGRINSSDFQGLEVYIGKDDQDIAELFGVQNYSKERYVYYLNGFNQILRDKGFKGTTTLFRELPSTFKEWSDTQQRSFMRGLFSANGSALKGKTSAVTLKATSFTLISQVGEYLNSIGINYGLSVNKPKVVSFANGDYECKQSYAIQIKSYSGLLKFAEKIGFVHQYKRDNLSVLIKRTSPMITSVTPCGVRNVYDFTLENDNHLGVISTNGKTGYVVHNCEIALRPYQFCNLVDTNISTVESQEDLDARAKAGAFIATLQAGYTDFHYLRSCWRETTEEDALIGVGHTGIASDKCRNLDLKRAAQVVLKENERVAKILGINPGARTTTVKPAGTTSLVLGCSSGIHGYHSEYYIRRIRVGKDEPVYAFLKEHLPCVLEDDYFRPQQQAVISIPQKADDGGILRDESVFDLLERVKRWNIEWVREGHRSGDNYNNVSATISIKNDEWEAVGEWMWNNREYYNGLSVLPFDGGTYIQAPFEETTKEVYDELVSKLVDIDFSQIREYEDATDLSGEVACAGGQCEVF